MDSASPSILGRTDLTLRRVSGRTADARADSLRHLSLGVRVSRGSDDPAKLIASENLAAEGRKLDEAVKNADRAAAVTDVVESTLAEVSENLRDLRRLVSSSANLISTEEIAANQLEADRLIENVNRLIQRAQFNGKPLLRAVPPQAPPIPLLHTKSGVTTLDHAQTGQGGRPHAYSLLNGDTHQLTGNQWTSLALPGAYAATSDTVLKLEFSSAGEGEIHGVGFYDSNSSVAASRTFRFHGTQNHGNATYNDYVSGWREYEIRPQSFGITSFTHVTLINDADTVAAAAAAESRFRNVRLYEDTPAVTGQPTVTLPFSLTSDVRTAQTGQDTLTIPELSIFTLGTNLASVGQLRTGGTHTLAEGNLQEAGDAVDAAIKLVNRRRGQIGAFRRHAVESTQRGQREAALQNADATSAVRDTRFAEETAALARVEVLRQSQTDLFDIQRQQAARVLDLLG